ncbi:phycobilisome rod-core linker polypeptide [Hyella patelloides]|uniref:phycobilisome rod-core linker polypeptide n=1 Tax=Hyella patelloides TaxID=1982969 RepID=UPI001FEAA82E|nr:phycobilisome rod-core linker polypeptide [Hyella patelloides]
MNNTFISPVIGRASELGVSFYEDSDRLELLSNADPEEKEILIRAIYRQILGNAYVMESERLAVPESQLKQGEIGVRGFIRQVAKSELYRSRFVENSPRYRTIELNFKHFLGRAPESYEEMQIHSQILDQNGYEADIDSYLDSDEYQNKYGENIVPYYSGYKTQTGKSVVGFSHLFQLLRGASSSDKNLMQGKYSRLNSSIITNTPSNVIPPSTANSYGGITNIQKLITDALKVNKPVATVAKTAVGTNGYDTFSLEQKNREQKAKIQQLKQKLAELSPLANIGAASLNKWQSKGVAGTSLTTNNLPSQVSSQEQIIADLEVKVADAQRLASFAETRLNKWRSKVFF